MSHSATVTAAALHPHHPSTTTPPPLNPSTCLPPPRFWFYGDDNPGERLRLLDAYLSEFEARPANSAVETQKLYTQERKVTEYYAAGDGEEGEQKVRGRAD